MQPFQDSNCGAFEMLQTSAVLSRVNLCRLVVFQAVAGLHNPLSLE